MSTVYMYRIYRINFFRLAITAFFLALASQVNAATQCNFLPEKEKPQWILQPPLSDKNYYGVGAFEITDPSKSLEALKQAKVAALNELSSNIEVQLRSSFTQQQELSQSNNEETVEKKVSSVTNIVTNTTLKDINYEELWLDRDSCIIWVMAAVNKTAIDDLKDKEHQQRNILRLDALIKTSRNDSLDNSERLENLGEARQLLNEINFIALNSGADRGPYLSKIHAISDSLGTDIDTANTVKQHTLNADISIIASNNTSSYQEKNLYIRDAINSLSQILTAHPFSSNNTFWAEAASFNVGEIYKNSNDSCKAIVYYERILNNTSSDSWANKADGELSSLQCTREDRLRSAWLQSFAGRNVTLICAYKTNNQIHKWDYLCDKIQSTLQEYGATTDANSITDDKLKKSFSSISQVSVSNATNNSDTYVAIADGTISTRNNKKNPFGPDYQFKGKVSVYMIKNGNIEFSDRFRGAGGWNPMSEEMAMEVLGVHVAKRWNKRYSAVLSKQ